MATGRPCGPADHGRRREPREPECCLGRHRAERSVALGERRDDAGADEQARDAASSSEWSFPPKPDTHHVRWIACHPLDANRLWVAIEAARSSPRSTAPVPGATAFPVACGSLRALASGILRGLVTVVEKSHRAATKGICRKAEPEGAYRGALSKHPAE